MCSFAPQLIYVSKQLLSKMLPQGMHSKVFLHIEGLKNTVSEMGDSSRERSGSLSSGAPQVTKYIELRLALLPCKQIGKTIRMDVSL